MERDKNLLELRPHLDLETDSEMTDVEQFQNETLRPILKLQKDLTWALLGHSKNFSKQKMPDDRAHFMKAMLSFISADLQFRNMLIGIIIGHFTIKEYEYYVSKKSELNKRLLNMQAQRYTDFHFA